MANNIAVSVTCDVADLTAKRAIMSAELRAATADLNTFAKTAKTAGMTDELRTSMLASADAVAKSKAQISLLDREMKTLTASQIEETVAVEANTAAHVSSRAATEGLVLVHEALQGRYTRMTGSAMILTQALMGQEAVTSVVAAAMSPLGIAAIAAAAGIGYLAYEEYEATKASTAMAAAFALTGRGATNSAEATRAQVDRLADMEGVSRKAADALVAFDAAHAEVNGRISESANQLAPQFIKAWGEDGPSALNKLKTSLAEMSHAGLEESIKKFEELNQSLLHLKPAEQQVIEGMLETGDTAGAVNRILADLAANGGGHIQDLNSVIVTTQAELNKATAEAEALKQAAATPVDPDAVFGIELAAMRADARVKQLTGDLNRLKSIAATPAHGDDPADAFAKSHATLLSLRDSATRAKDAVAELHREMETRRNNPNDKEAADYFAHQAKMDHDLERKIDPGDFKKPRIHKEGGESPLSQMENDLREQEFKIKSETGDWSKDMQAFEVQFWEGKLNAAKKGSKLYGEIHTRLEQAKLADGSRAAQQARQMAQNDAETDLNILKKDIATRRSAVEALYNAQKIDAQSKHDLLKQLAEEEVQDELEALERKKKAYGADVVAVHEAANAEREIRANLNSQINALAQQLTSDLKKEEDRRTKDATKSAKEQAQTWKQANAEIFSAEDKLVTGIIGGRETMGQILRSMAAELVTKEIEADLHYLTEKKLLNAEGLASDQMTAHGGLLAHWLGETAKTAATTVGSEARVAATASGAAQSAAITGMHNLKEITSHAATAAAAAYHAMAGIPVVGPALGAVAAAATFTAVEAFGALASFDVGTNVVPRDMIAQIHAGERIIPAADNRQLMAAINDNGRQSNSGRDRATGTDGGGDVHHHYAINITAADSRDVRRLFMDNKGAFSETMKKVIKEAHFSNFRR